MDNLQGSYQGIPNDAAEHPDDNFGDIDLRTARATIATILDVLTSGDQQVTLINDPETGEVIAYTPSGGGSTLISPKKVEAILAILGLTAENAIRAVEATRPK